MRFTLVHDRFQVCHPEHGLLYTDQRIAGARSWAMDWIKRNEGESFVELWDSMAHVGKPELWRLAVWGDHFNIKILEYKQKGPA
jgi:hypothetical protein